MNCNDVEIWLDGQIDLSGVSLPVDVLKHMKDCDSCTRKVNTLQQAYLFIEEQRKQELSTSKQKDIIEALSKRAEPKANSFFLAADWFSKVAAILIVGLGVLLGIVLAQKYFTTPSNEVLWGNEFSMLSENLDDNLFEE